MLVTAPLLPWGLFLSRLSETSTLLSEQSQGGMSAWFFPVLVPFAVIALIVMGRQRASWWFIPALWPSTQWYYSLMAMPALTPLTAAILAAPVQGGPAVAAIVAAIEIWWRARQGRLARAAPTPAAASVKLDSSLSSSRRELAVREPPPSLREYEGEQVQQRNDEEQRPEAGQQRQVFEGAPDHRPEQVGRERHVRCGRVPEGIREHEIREEDRCERDGRRHGVPQLRRLDQQGVRGTR